MTLAAIREHVLAKLELGHAPNTTGRVLPRVPPDIVREYERGRAPDPELQADEPHYFFRDDEDDFHARTDRVLAFPR